MPASMTCTPTTEQCATIFLALELSQKTWLVTILSPHTHRISRHRLAAGDGDGLLTLIGRSQARAARALGRASRVASCYEAGYDGFWLHRLLVAAGIDNHVFDPASIAVDRRARRAKTDRIDGEMLLRVLMAHARGEPRVVRVVRVPSREQEDARRTERERERLVKERTGHVNRIKALMRTLGMDPGDLRRADWPAWLARQRDRQGRPVPPRLAAELGREHARLMLVREQIAALEAERAHDPHPALARQAAQLATLRGIGPAFATTLAGELYWKDFKNRREVAGYCGLAPSPWQSGGLARDQGISKAGNRRARHTAIELAWLWLQHQPDSELSRWYRARVNGARGRLRRVMIVALARKLVVALWRFLTTGLVPSDAVCKA